MEEFWSVVEADGVRQKLLSRFCNLPPFYRRILCNTVVSIDLKVANKNVG